MYIPQDAAGYIFALLGLIGWGSWGNMLIAGGSIVRFEVFYIDYSLGIFIFVLIMNAILGQLSIDDNGVFAGMTWAGHDFTEASGASIGWAIFSGIVFNFANILLCQGIALAGLAVGFAIAIGLAFVMGVVWLYLQNQETTKAGLLFAGLALGVIALLSFAQMYNIKDSDEKKKKALEAKSDTKFANADAGSDLAAQKAATNWGSDIDAEKAAANEVDIYSEKKAAASFDMEKEEKKTEEHKPSFVYMVVMLLVAGLVMSGWGPLLGFGSIDPTDPSTLHKLSPYGQMFWFALAIIISDLLFIPLILAFPVDGSPSVPFSAFVEGFKCGWKGHLLCLLGGMIWAFGFMGNTLSSSSCSLNRATAYAIGQCAPLAAIAWATLLWREFKGVRRIVWIFLLTSVAFYVGAVVLASISRETSDNACDIVLSTPIPTTL